MNWFSTYWAGLIHFLQFLQICKACHKMFCFAIYNAAIFRLTLENHTMFKGIKEKTRFHTFFFVLCFFSLKLCDIFLGAINYATRNWRLRVLTCLGLASLCEVFIIFLNAWFSGIIHCFFLFFIFGIKGIKALFYLYLIVGFPQALFFCLSLCLQESNFHKGLNIC